MSEDKCKQWRFTAEEKRMILTEADQPGVTITAVCLKHRIAVTQFYRWRAVAEQGLEEALKAKGRGRSKGSGNAEKARLQAEIERLHAVVTEITAESLELKKNLRLESGMRVSAAVKAEVIAWVEKTERRSGWPLERIWR